MSVKQPPNDKDVLNIHFPIYASAAVALFLLYRVVMSKIRNEPIQPKYMSSGVFPAAFMTGVGALACHETLLDMLAYPGGLTAWSPAVITTCLAGWVAYRGQRAASGGELGLQAIMPVVAMALFSISWLIADRPEEVEQLTKAQMRRKAKEAAKRAAQGLDVDTQLYLEKGSDIITENLHVALGIAVVIVLVLALVNGPGVFPRSLKNGPFPTCFMVVTGVMAWNSFLREARSFDGGSFDDFIPALSAMCLGGVVAAQGAKMQNAADG